VEFPAGAANRKSTWRRAPPAVQAEWEGLSPERRGVSEAASRGPGVVDVVPALPGCLEIYPPPWRARRRLRSGPPPSRQNGPGRGGSRLPPLPQIRTCPIKASGSSGYGLAAPGDARACGHGNGNAFSSPFSRDHGNCPRRLRRDSHFRHRRTTSYRKRCRQTKLPITP
jgi:hypothetical protein